GETTVIKGDLNRARAYASMARVLAALIGAQDLGLIAQTYLARIEQLERDLAASDGSLVVRPPIKAVAVGLPLMIVEKDKIFEADGLGETWSGTPPAATAGNPSLAEVKYLLRAYRRGRATMEAVMRALMGYRDWLAPAAWVTTWRAECPEIVSH